MKRIIPKISKKEIIATVPKVSLGLLPMLISLEFGSSLLAGYCALRYFLSARMMYKALGIALVLILLDEFLRRGYFFNPSDLLVLRWTHEKSFVGVFLLGAINEGYQRYFKKPLVS